MFQYTLHLHHTIMLRQRPYKMAIRPPCLSRTTQQNTNKSFQFYRRHIETHYITMLKSKSCKGDGSINIKRPWFNFLNSRTFLNQ